MVNGDTVHFRNCSFWSGLFSLLGLSRQTWAGSQIGIVALRFGISIGTLQSDPKG